MPTEIQHVHAAPRANATASSAVSAGPQPTVTAAELTEKVGYTRGVARNLTDDIEDLHTRTQTREWQDRTSTEAKKSVPMLLDELAELGFSWRDIARLVHVSVPAVRKWRAGGGSTGSNRRDLAALLAACKLIEEHYLIHDVASWFEVPVYTGCSITPADIYEAANVGLVFELANGHGDNERILDAFKPGWRDELHSSFEVFVADDGRPALRPRA